MSWGVEWTVIVLGSWRCTRVFQNTFCGLNVFSGCLWGLWSHENISFGKNQEENALDSKLEKQSPLSLQMMLSSCGFSFSEASTGRNGARRWLSLPPTSKEWVSRGRLAGSKGVVVLRAADPEGAQGDLQEKNTSALSPSQEGASGRAAADGSPVYPLFCPRVDTWCGGIW